MPNKETEPMDIIINRRILLAKQLFNHAKDHSNMSGDFNNMLAMHGFHNAIEVILKAIMLKDEIRTEKALDIRFVAMLDAIDKHYKNKVPTLKLPYRTDMMNINQHRNLVQHHGTPPSETVVVETRVLTRKFLEQSFKEYFQANYDDISQIMLIKDKKYRDILNKCKQLIASNNYHGCIGNAKVLYEIIISEIHEILLSDAKYSLYSFAQQIEQEDIKEEFQKVYEKLNEARKEIVSLFFKIDLLEYARFKDLTPIVHFVLTGNYHCVFDSRKIITSKEAKWVLDFVIKTIISIQSQGIAIDFPKDFEKSYKLIMEESTA